MLKLGYVTMIRLSKVYYSPVVGSQFDPLYGFSKNSSSRERVKLRFSVNFNIIISHIFPENFIEIPQVVQKI